jgi:hypothetical protein
MRRASLPEDALAPAATVDGDGRRLDGELRYVLHFEASELPPVNASWSLTLYDADGALVDNPAGRYALGARDALRFGPDGSLDVYVQAEPPEGDRRANWLPAPAGRPFDLTLRLYWPKRAALDGTWQPPPVRRIGGEAMTSAR